MKKLVNYVKKYYFIFCCWAFAALAVASVIYAYLFVGLPHIEESYPIMGTIYAIMLAINSLLLIGIIIVKDRHCLKLTAVLSGIVILLSWSTTWWGWIGQSSNWFLLSAFLTMLSCFCYFILCLRWSAIFAPILPYFPLVCLLLLNKETYDQVDSQRIGQERGENPKVILLGLKDNYIYTQEFGMEKICPQDTSGLKPGIIIRHTVSPDGDVRIKPVQ